VAPVGKFSTELDRHLNMSDVEVLVAIRAAYEDGNSPRVLGANKENITQYYGTITFLAEWFARNDVRYLEKIATAYYVTKKNPRDPSIERARTISMLKPHIDIISAEEAIRVVDEKRRQAKVELEESFA
jgi:hypothetical protein